MLATKKDIEKINKNIETIDRQIYEIQKKVYGEKPNSCMPTKNFDSTKKSGWRTLVDKEEVDDIRKVMQMNVDNLYTQLTATNEDVKKQYEETKNAIINLQKQITEIHKKVDWNKTLDDYYNIKMDNIGKPNWITDYSPTHSLEVIIDSQKATIIKMQNQEKKYLKKIQELEYANQLLQEKLDNKKPNTELVHEKMQLKMKIDLLEIEIEKLKNEKYRLEMSNETYVKQIQLLNEKINAVEIEKINLQRKIFR